MESTVGGPSPYPFDGVIVNVYAYTDIPVYDQEVPLVVTVVGSDDTIVYKVAPYDTFHARSIVVAVELLITNPVTADGDGTGGTFSTRV